MKHAPINTTIETASDASAAPIQCTRWASQRAPHGPTDITDAASTLPSRLSTASGCAAGRGGGRRRGRVLASVASILATAMLAVSLPSPASAHAPDDPTVGSADETKLTDRSGDLVFVAIDGSGEVATVARTRDPNTGAIRTQVLSDFHVGEVYDEIRETPASGGGISIAANGSPNASSSGGPGNHAVVVLGSQRLIYLARQGAQHYVVWENGRSKAFSGWPTVMIDRDTRKWTAFAPVDGSNEVIVLFDGNERGQHRIVEGPASTLKGTICVVGSRNEIGSSSVRSIYAPIAACAYDRRTTIPGFDPSKWSEFLQLDMCRELRGAVEAMQQGNQSACDVHYALTRSGAVMVPEREVEIWAPESPTEMRIQAKYSVRRQPPSGRTNSGRQNFDAPMIATHHQGRWSAEDEANPTTPREDTVGSALCLDDGSFAFRCKVARDGTATAVVSLFGKVTSFPLAQVSTDSPFAAQRWLVQHPTKPVAAFVLLPTQSRAGRRDPLLVDSRDPARPIEGYGQFETIAFVGDELVFAGRLAQNRDRRHLVIGDRSSAEFEANGTPEIIVSKDRMHFAATLAENGAQCSLFVDGVAPVASGESIRNVVISDKGEAVAFVQGSTLAETVVVLRGGTRTEHPLPEGTSSQGGPVLSPDGTKWAIACSGSSPRRVFVLLNDDDVTGGEFGGLRSLSTLCLEGSAAPSMGFSPDGKGFFAVMSDARRREMSHVVVNGTAYGPYQLLGVPRWDPSGALVFPARRPEAESAMLRVRIQPGELRVAPKPLTKEEQIAQGTAAADAAAAERVKGMPLTRPNHQLGAIDTAGEFRLRKSTAPMGPVGTAWNFVISPRGDRMAYSRQRKAEVALPGGVRKQDTIVEAVIDGVVVAEGKSIRGMSFSEDSSSWFVGLLEHYDERRQATPELCLHNGVRRPTTDELIFNRFAISADGKRLATWTKRSSSREGNSFVLVVDGKEVYSTPPVKGPAAGRGLDERLGPIVFSPDGSRFASWASLDGMTDGSKGVFIIDGRTHPMPGAGTNFIEFLDAPVGCVAMLTNGSKNYIWSEGGGGSPQTGMLWGAPVAVRGLNEVIWAASESGSTPSYLLYSTGSTMDEPACQGPMQRHPVRSRNGANAAFAVSVDPQMGPSALILGRTKIAEAATFGKIVLSDDGKHVAASARPLGSGGAIAQFAGASQALFLDRDFVTFEGDCMDIGSTPVLSACGKHAAIAVRDASRGRTGMKQIVNGVAEPVYEQVSDAALSPSGGSVAYMALDRGRALLVVNGKTLPVSAPMMQPRDPKLGSSGEKPMAPVFLEERVVRVFVVENGEITRLDVALEGEIAPRKTFAEAAAGQRSNAAATGKPAGRSGDRTRDMALEGSDAAETEEDGSLSEEDLAALRAAGMSEKQIEDMKRAIEAAKKQAEEMGAIFGGTGGTGTGGTGTGIAPARGGGKAGEAADADAFKGTWSVEGTDAKGRSVRDTITIDSELKSARAARFGVASTTYKVRRVADLLVLTAEARGDGFTMSWTMELDGDEMTVEETLDRLGREDSIEFRGARE